MRNVRLARREERRVHTLTFARRAHRAPDRARGRRHRNAPHVHAHPESSEQRALDILHRLPRRHLGPGQDVDLARPALPRTHDAGRDDSGQHREKRLRITRRQRRRPSRHGLILHVRCRLRAVWRKGWHEGGRRRHQAGRHYAAGVRHPLRRWCDGLVKLLVLTSGRKRHDENTRGDKRPRTAVRRGNQLLPRTAWRAPRPAASARSSSLTSSPLAPSLPPASPPAWYSLSLR